MFQNVQGNSIERFVTQFDRVNIDLLQMDRFGMSCGWCRCSEAEINDVFIEGEYSIPAKLSSVAFVHKQMLIEYQ